MTKKTKSTLTIVTVLMLATCITLTACGVDIVTTAESHVDTGSFPSSSVESTPASSRVASSSNSYTSSSSSSQAASAAKETSSSQADSSSRAPSSQPTSPQPQQPAAPSSSQSPAVAPAPDPTPCPAPEPTSAPSPAPAPAPEPAPGVDIASVIAQGHAYAAGKNMSVNGGAASCFGPIDTTGRTTESVLADMYAQFDYFYASLQSVPEYDPNVTLPCYNLTSSGSVIYLYFG